MGISNHNFIVKNDGTVWATGSSTVGQLGLGDTTNKTTFTKVNISDVKSIYCGNSHTFILKNDGTVWSTGANSYGQLGLGDTTQRATFTQVNIDNVKSVSCGDSHSFILKNDGTLWSTGYNNFGNLGLGDTTVRSTFTKVDIDNVKSVACGSHHTYIFKNDGAVWATGQNNNSQLGLGDTTHRKVFTKVDITDIKNVYCGNSHTFIIKNDGTVWTTGYNTFGQLGLGDTINRTTFTKVDIDNVKSVSCGGYQTYILKNDGTVWSTGLNSDGRLGLGDTTNRSAFTKVNIDNIESVYCGNYHTVIIKKDGTLWSTGYNIAGQLGLGDTTDRTTFTKVNIDNVKGFTDEIEILLYIIKTLQSKYTINKDLKILTELIDSLTPEIIQSKGIDIDTINENIDILPDEFSLVSDKEFGLTIKGLKDNEQMIIASNDFLATIKEHVDYFKSESITTETSKVKVVFSVDSGLTWKTYQDGLIVDTNITIPCKAFNLLSAQELQEWNIAKSEILLNGIDANILETIDFNAIEFDKIRFAYAMSVEDIEDKVNLSKLIWQFDSKGSMQQLKNTEYDLDVCSDKLEFTSLINTDMIKINVFPDGMGVSEDMEFATENEIDILFN